MLSFMNVLCFSLQQLLTCLLLVLFHLYDVLYPSRVCLFNLFHFGMYRSCKISCKWYNPLNSKKEKEKLQVTHACHVSYPKIYLPAACCPLPEYNLVEVLFSGQSFLLSYPITTQASMIDLQVKVCWELQTTGLNSQKIKTLRDQSQNTPKMKEVRVLYEHVNLQQSDAALLQSYRKYLAT